MDKGGLKRKSEDTNQDAGKNNTLASAVEIVGNEHEQDVDATKMPKLSIAKDTKIKLKLGTVIKPKQVDVKTESVVKQASTQAAVAKAFCADDDDDEDSKEEMPMEAKMKMRNIGRKTPTSSGPNSYGKTYLGFCDSRKLAEKKLLEKAEELSKQ